MTQETKDESQIEYNFLVYEYHTWGTHGQHTKTIVVVIDIEKKTQKPVWEVIDVKWIKNDSRKNYHREAYSREEDIINLLKGKILKVVRDYQSASKREISTKYYYVSDEELEEIEAERGVKVNGKYYDILMIDNKKIMINKDEIIVQ